MARFLQINGRGTVREVIIPKEEEQLPKRKFATVYVDPKDIYTKKERYEHYLLKRYEGKPFNFLNNFDRFITKYKSKFYINIYNILINNFKRTLPKIRKEKKRIDVSKLNNKFDVLKEEKLFSLKIKPVVVKNRQQKISFLQKDIVTPRLEKRRRQSERRRYYKEYAKLHEQSTIKLINYVLLDKLREKIREKYLLRCTKMQRYNLLERRARYEQYVIDHLEAQMESEQNIDPGASTSHGNTTYDSHRDASSSSASPVVKDIKRFRDYASAESSTGYSHMTDRYFPHKVYRWSKNDSRGDSLVQLTLPLDFIQTHPNSPNCTLFNSYAYWDGDMEVRLMLNANKFQVGSLQMAWYYGQDYEKNFNRRSNVYTASQQAHCVVAAAASNEGSILVPFRYYKPKMGTKVRSDDPGRLNMGKLTVRVLNELDCPTSIYNECHFTIAFRFINSNFSGMLARDLGSISLEANMFRNVTSRLVKAALDLLDPVDPDANRDNPPLIAPASAVVPWSAHSWSVGDKLSEPTNCLRLMATGQTPHPSEALAAIDEMTIPYVASMFGLISIVKWSFDDAEGKVIFSLPGSPQFDTVMYQNYIYENTTCYAMPPVAVLCGLYAYWRGSLGLRLDIISSQYHTGRLIIAYIPRVLQNPSLEQLKSSPHAVIDLQGETRRYYFKIPYIADRPWWPTRSFDEKVLPPSYIYCMVMNPLVPMDQVTKTIDINLYLHGCEDFELSVPVSPRLGLSTYNATVIFNSTVNASTASGYTPMYVGTWRYADGGKVNVLRYGEVSDHVVQFNSLKRGIIYAPDNNRNGKRIFWKNKISEWYIMAMDVDVNNGYSKYALFFSNLSAAKTYLAGKSAGQPNNMTTDFFRFENSHIASGVLYFTPVDVTTFDVMAEMDERNTINDDEMLSILPSVSSTQFGRLTFGEDFSNLKTLCRRYQLYAHYWESDESRGAVENCICVPILPQGIPRTSRELDQIPVYNSQREGVIPIIASAYRYYRGGLRFRFVWRSNWDCTVRIEHRPDERLTNYLTKLPRGHGRHYNDGYAIVLQQTRVNNIIEFEIPFYQCGLFGFLQNPLVENNLESRHFSLGNLYIGFTCNIRADVAPKFTCFELYYSLADDHKFSIFQGFPPMMIAPDNELNQLEYYAIPTKARLQVEGNMGKITSYLFGEKADATFEKVSHVVDKCDKLTEAANSFLKPIPLPEADADGKPKRTFFSTTDSIYTWITEIIPQEMLSLMHSFVSNLVHCIINPTIKTICWALASFLASIGLLCGSVISTFMKCIKRIFKVTHPEAKKKTDELAKRFKDELKACKLTEQQVYDVYHKHLTDKNYKPTTEEDKKVVNFIQRHEALRNETHTGATKLEANMADKKDDKEAQDARAGLVSTIIVSIASMLGCIGRLPKTIPDFARSMYNGLGKFAFTTNHLTTFFKNNLSWIVNAYRWVIGRSDPRKKLAVELTDKPEDIKDFVEEALILLDEAHARKIENNPRWNLRVYLAAAKASLLMMKLAQNELSVNAPTVISVCRDIIKKRNDLVKLAISPPVKFEPYVMAIHGTTNIGKSHLCQNIGKDLLRAIHYKSYEELVYTRTPKNDFWNGLRNQPICLYDDFVCIEGEPGLQQIGELFCLKSRAIFNPPQAAIEEKHIRYNPILVFLAMNNAFPKIAGVACQEAFYRRRDILIKVIKNEEFYRKHKVSVATGSPKHFPMSAIKNYEHLLFGLHDDVMDANGDAACTMTYAQLLEHIRTAFRNHYENETEMYLTAMREMNEFYPDDEDYVTGSLFDKIESSYIEKAREVNLRRCENIADLKALAVDAISKITSRSDKNYVEAERVMHMFKRVNEVQYKLIVKDTIFDPNYDEEHAGNQTTGPTQGADPIMNVKMMKETFKSDQLQKRITRAVKEHFESQPSTSSSGQDTKMEANMDSLQKTVDVVNSWPPEPCPHDNLHSNFNIFRDGYTYKPGDFNIPFGIFKYEDHISIPEAPCNDNPNCRFRDEKKMKRFYDEYMQDAVRKEQIKRGNFNDIPRYVILTMAKEVASQAELLVGPPTAYTWRDSEWYHQKLDKCSEEIKRIMEFLSSVVESTGGFIMKCLWWALKIVGMIGSVLCLFGLSKALIGGGGSEPEAEMVSSGDYKTFGGKAKNIKDIAVKYVANVGEERESAIIRVIKRNTMFIKAEFSNGSSINGRIVGLIDHYALSVDHYHDKFSSLPDDARCYLVANGLNLRINYSDLEYHKFERSSLGYYKLPIQVPPFKDLIKHIAKISDHRYVSPEGSLVEPEFDNLQSVRVAEQHLKRIVNIDIPASNGFEAFTIPDGYKYQRGGRGVCGAILLSNNTNRMIIGVHVAGDIKGGLGMSEALCAETFEFLYEKAKIKDIVEANMFEKTDGFIAPQTNVLLLGAVQNCMAHRESGKSQVIPTECSGEIFPLYCAPPVLSKYDPRIAENPYSPMQEGVNKHGFVTNNFKNCYLDAAYDDLNNKILSLVKPQRMYVGKLPMSIAVVGSPNLPHYDKLDFDTSEGFPYSAMRQGCDKGKKWLLDLHYDIKGYYRLKGIHPFLEEIMDMKEQQRLKRELPFTLFVDCLKDRKLPIAKAVTPGKVRIFSISPLDFTIQCRQLFMDFTVAYQEARFEVEHAVGIDVNSYEWTDMVNRLHARGNNIVTLDYKGYGPSLNAACAELSIKIIRQWYRINGDLDPQHDLCREMMGYEQIHSAHLCFRMVYRTLCGLPSGGPLTVVLNSLVNCLYIRLTWIIIFTENLDFQSPSMSAFAQHVTFFVYGDDVIMSVSDEVKEYYNSLSMADVFSRHNIGISNAAKDNEMVKYLSLYDPDTSFLKHTIRPHPSKHGIFLAALDKTSVEDTCNWTFSSWRFLLRQISMESCEATVRSAYGHGPDYFNRVRQKCQSYWQQKGEHLPLPTWRDIDRQNFG